jgi:hypothetical protein
MCAGARRGVSVLAIVVMLAVISGVVVMAYHSLWRGTSRTMFSVQEHRQLMNLARSSLAEAYYELQRSLDQSSAEWFDWCTSPEAVPEKTFEPDVTRQEAGFMTADVEALRYTTQRVTLARVKRLDESAGGGEMGVLDMRVVVEVRRRSPAHHAVRTMAERRNFWLADDLGPYSGAGRHVEVSPTPAATVIEGD